MLSCCSLLSRSLKLIYDHQARHVAERSSRLPGVDLVRHHYMLGCVLDHGPQRVLHPTVEVVLVLSWCLLALAGFA